MIDKEIEGKIKKTKEFMELWMKFHHLYQEALKKQTIDPEEENTFLETKSLIARKYQSLIEFLQMPPSAEDKTFEVISQVLSLQGVSALSDVQIQEIENGWHQSYLALNKMVGSLEAHKEALAKINPLSLFLSRVASGLWRGQGGKLIKTGILLLMAYIVLVRLLHVDEKVRLFLSEFQPLQDLIQSILSFFGQK